MGIRDLIRYLCSWIKSSGLLASIPSPYCMDALIYSLQAMCHFYPERAREEQGK